MNDITSQTDNCGTCLITFTEYGFCIKCGNDRMGIPRINDRTAFDNFIKEMNGEIAPGNYSTKGILKKLIETDTGSCFTGAKGKDKFEQVNEFLKNLRSLIEGAGSYESKGQSL